MKILFDNQKFTTDAYGGIVRYFSELMRHYDALPDVDYDMPIDYSNTEYLYALPRFKDRLKPVRTLKDFLPNRHFRGKARLYRLWCTYISGWDNRLVMRKALHKRDFDVFHPTYYDGYFLKDLKRKPFVLTIYDMIHEMYLSKYAAIDPTALRKKKLAHKAARIIAISESTKRDVMRILGVPADKIDVVYLGNSLFPTEDSIRNRPHDAPARYLLFVGDRHFYKNFPVFLTAVAPLLNNTDLHLACVGGPAFTDAETDLIASLEVADKVVWRKGFDQVLAQYYAHAEAFVFPSLYEGFGIPVLEAFACGCPAIISRGGSLPEVGGDAVVYVDPTDPESMRQAVADVVASPALRQDLITRGRQQLQKFAWDKTARETLDVYRRVMTEAVGT